MDLSKGRFIDDAEETILVNDKVVNGYASDNADIAKIRYNNLNADDKKAQQTKDAVGFLDMMMGAINSAADWVSDETEVPDVLKPAGDIAGRAIEGTSRGVARLGASMFYGQQKLLAEQTLKPKRKAGAGLLSDIAFGVGQALRDATGEEPVSTSSVAEQSLRDTIKEIDKEERQVQNAISEVLGTDESTLGQFSEGFGGGVASLLLTKLNYILAYYGFMLPTYSNIMSSAAKNENINMFGAGAVSTIAGIFNAAMEKWGAQQILEPIKVRNVASAAAKNFLTEFTTEYSQEWEELLPLLFYTKDEEFRDESGNIDWGKVNKQPLMAGGIGGFSGALLGMYSAGRVLDKSKRRKTIPYEDVSNIMKTRQVGEGGGEGPGGEPPSAGASKIRNEEEKPVDAIGKLIERGYTEEQAEQIIAALEDKSLITDELKKLAPGIDKVADAVEYMKQELTNKEYVAERLAKGLNTLLDPASFPGGSIDGLKNELRELKPYLDEEAAKIAKAEAAKTNVRDLLKIEGNFREEQKKAMEDTYQAAMEAGASELGVTPREYASPLTIATLAGENTQEVVDRLNSGEMTEEEQRMTYSAMAVANKEEMVVGDVKYFPDGTYDDGEHLYAPDGTILFQRAFAGSAQKYIKPSLEAIGTGTDVASHGYGLYYALKYGVADEYRQEQIARGKLEYDGKVFDAQKERLKYIALYSLFEGKISKEDFIKRLQSQLEDVSGSVSTDENVQKNKEKTISELNELIDFVKQIDVSKIEKPTGQVMEAEIPENPYLLDEQKKYDDQPEVVRNALDEIFNSVSDDFKSKKDYLDTYKNVDGRSLYMRVSDIAYYNKYGKSATSKEAFKLGSELLNSFGVKGITYEGLKDGRCFVVFNPEDVSAVRRFFEEETGGKEPLGFADIQEQAVSLVGLLSGRNITTLPHEMTHFFTNLHVLNCIKFGKYDSIQKVMEYFDVTDPRQLIENRDIQERLARMGVRYVMENEAPTAGLRRYFEMFKRFGRKLVSSWKSRGLINEEELPEDIRDFFDSLLGKKLTEKVNIERIQEQSSDIVNAIKKIRSGQQVDINGLPINETRKLMKEASIRIPRAPQNLRTALINAGGINTEFAKNVDLQQLSGQEKDYRLFNRNGMIDSEDSLIDFLVNEGFMERGMEETYDDRSEQWDRAMELIENMEESYREQDQEKLLERERAIAVSDEANRIINAVGAEDAFEVIELIDSLKGRAVVEKEYLDSLERRIKQLDKDYKRLTDELLKNQAQEFAAREKEATTKAKEELKQYRDDVVDFIRAQDLELKDKAKLIAVIKQANTKATFDRVIKEVERRSRELYRKEQVKTLSDMIQKEVSTRKPPLKNQKYDYENNKLFNDLREWNKFTQEKAENLLNEFMNDQEFMENLNFEDEIRLRFLQHKALGAKSSPQLLQKLIDDIQYAKRSGIEARSEEEYNKAMSKEDIKNEMLDEIEKRKGKPTVYVKWVSNLYSSLYTIFGKNVADKFQLETVQNRAQMRASSHMANAINKIKSVYGIKSKGDFLKLISQLSTQNAEITTVREDVDTPLSKRGITHKLSTLDIIDIYNAIKNEKTRDDYYYWYGEQQISDLLSRLTPKEMMFGDMMQESVNERYDDVNAAYIKNFYIDLPKVDNYWMATSEHKEDLTILDMYKNYKSQTPSFVKERTKSRTLPKPGNAWQKYSKHIQGTYWLTDMAEKYTELSNILKAVRIRNAIENKLGKGVYKALQDQVEMASYSGLMNNVDFVTGVVDSIINNVTVAKIALAVPVLSGQLSSVVLYAENMGMAKWSAGFLAGLSHPRQTYKFMQENVGEFLKNRFQGGYDETINMILKEAEEGKKKYLLGAKGKYNLMNALTSFVRTGDVGAIIFGGYPRLKELLETMPKEKAIEQWEFETLRGQQSGVTVSKSTFQQQKGFARLFTAFRNFQYQANRKIVDSVYGYLNGDMTAAQAGKTIALYAGASAATYAAFKLAANALLFGWDKLDELEDEIIMTIATQELSIIPGLDSVINYAIRRAMGKKAFPSPNILVINDLFNSVNKSMKKEKTPYDYAEIVAPFFEMFMAVPVSRMTQTVKKIAKPTEDKKPKKKVAKKK